MALQKQNLPLSISAGVDTKTDSKNVLAANFLEVVNGDYTQLGALTKRFGYNALPRFTNMGVLIESAKALATFKTELLLFSNNNLYTFSESDQEWISKGNSLLASVHDEIVYAEPYNITNVSEAIIENHKLTVYIIRTGFVLKQMVYVLTDLTTNTIITRYVFGLSSLYSQVRVDVIANRFIVFYGTDQLRYFIVDFTNPAAPLNDTLLDSYSRGNFHSVNAFNRVYLVYEDSGGVNKVIYINSALSVSSAVPLITNATPVATPVASSCVSVENTSFIRISVCYGTTKHYLFGKDLNYQLHAVTSSVQAVSVRTIQDPEVPTQSLIVMTASGGGIVLGKITSAGVYTTTVASCFLQYTTHSDLIYSSGEVFFLLSNRLPLRSTYLVTYSLNIVCTVAVLDAYIDTRINTLDIDPQSLISLDSDTFLAPIVQITEAVGAFGVGRSLIPMKITEKVIDVGQLDNYFSAEAANNVLFSGGVLKMYDGNKLVEHGFLQDPKVKITPGLPVVEPDPGLTGGKAYQYALVYAWRDRAGQVHRSIPAFTTSYVVGSNPNFYSIEVTMNYLNFTQKDNVELELYRTEGNGTTYYKLSGPVTGTVFINEPNYINLSFAYRDYTSDAALIYGETLYTQAGTIENDAPYPSKYITNYKSRVFTILSDGRSMQYSKLITSGNPVEFSAYYIIELPDLGGVATCAMQMDDNFIIFKEQAVYAMNGEGPNDLGQQDDYRKPQAIATDCGCVDANSLVLTDLGIFFKSSKGIYILKRNMQVEYIGAPVERFNDLVITSATLLAGTNQVRFTTTSDVVLVYDYFTSRWAWYEGLSFVDSLVFKNQYVGIKGTGFVLQESKDFKDVDTFIPMFIESAWIQLNGIQGYERFWKLLILGTYKGPHKLRIQFAFDFSDSWTEETYIDISSIIDPLIYGSDPVYGGSGVYGGPQSLYQFGVNPKRQKCQAFKFRVSDVQDGPVIGESMQLSNFALEVGVKQGHNKLASKYSAGSK